MNDLIRRYSATRQQLRAYAQTSKRDIGSISLLAVSKTRPAEDILQLYRIGQRDFGENYLQEALAKQDQLAHLNIQWHFIGPIQSNKTRPIAHRFNWAHTLDRVKIAERLNQQRPDHLPALNCCIQINIDDESSKSGIALDDLPTLAEAVHKLPKLKLRGVMTIPAPSDDYSTQLDRFKQIASAMQKINAELGTQMDTLSMGMSGDLEAAIAAGSTLVRVGTAIFGPRNTPAQT